MSTTPLVQRDERTVCVENASYRWAHSVLTYALLIDVCFRGVVRHEAAWDLMAFVIVGGIFCSVYQAHWAALPHGWARKVTLVSLAAAVVAAAVAAIIVWGRG